MTTIRRPKIVKQTMSQSPPKFMEMKCQCGQIFSQSLKLTSHLFEKHIYSPQFSKMKSITKPLSRNGQQHKYGLNKYQQNKKKQQKSGDLLESAKNQRKAKQFKFDKQVDMSLDYQQRIQLKNQNYRSNFDDNKFPQTALSALSQSSNETNKDEKVSKPVIRRHRRQPTRQFNNSRIFMCGQCLIMFVYSAQLNVHVSVKHNGQYPDGCIFGLKKNQIFNFFKIPAQKDIFPRIPERERKFKCGCGSYYTASSSLLSHIKSRHNSKVPPGTINLPPARRIKKLIADNTGIFNGF